MENVANILCEEVKAYSSLVGRQTNTLVYGPGGYKFTDFLRVGLPLNLIASVVCAVTIPLVFPL